jgi:glyoxylase-like metal-dependent hydrolase (beta-lactamase superfamily II)
MDSVNGRCGGETARLRHTDIKEERGETLMRTFTRRGILGGAIAASAATTLAPALAAAPPIGKQTATWYRYKVGSIEVTVVSDGSNTFKFADGHVTNKTRDEVNAGLAAAFYEKDLMTTPYNPVVVNTSGKLVVIDTGTGEANYEKTKGQIGQFQTNLKAAGIDRNAIDIALISHFHGDHINGLLTPDNKPAFPNAEILVPAAEWKYFMDDDEMSRAPAGRMQDVFKGVRRVFDALGRKVTQYEPGKEVAPGITALATPGHTPGHNSHIVASGNSKVYIQADVTHVPFLFVRHPDWHAFYDQDGALAEATRRKVYDMLAAERMPVQGFHYPFPSLAHIEKSGTGYRENMVPWAPTI